MFSSHIKAPVLKQIILEELLGIPSEGTVSEENAEPAADDCKGKSTGKFNSY